MDISALRQELQTGHPVTGAYDADDEAAHSQLVAKNCELKLPIPSNELLAWSAQASASDRPRRIKIDEAAASHASEQIRAVAQAAQTMIDRDATSLDLRLPDREAMVDALVSSGVLSTADKEALVATATKPISRAEQIGCGGVRVGDVTRARSQS